MINFVTADFTQPEHAQALIFLMDAYAQDPMGGNAAIEPTILAQLPAILASRDDAFTVLAYADDTPIGLANCFVGFSTFAAKELVNVYRI